MINLRRLYNFADSRRLTLGIPEDVLFGWCRIKDVQSNGVHAVLLYHVFGVQSVVLRLAHLLPRHLDTITAQCHWLLI